MAKVATDETDQLISADKVEGTAVYGANRDKMGDVKSVMINKRSGKVEYAVLSIGGFLGVGTKYHPVPWSKLQYNTDLGGYHLTMTPEQLKGAPSMDRSDDYSGGYPRERETEVYDYYDEQPYWS